MGKQANSTKAKPSGEGNGANGELEALIKAGLESSFRVQDERLFDDLNFGDRLLNSDFDLQAELSAWKENGLRRKIRIETLGDWAEIGAVIERLEKLKLLGDQFLYTAANPVDLPMLREHGTYRLGTDGRPELAVYCCEFTQHEGARHITQVGDGGEPATRYSLWTYIGQNSGPQGSAVIVWHRDNLIDQGSAQFHFANPDKPHAAIRKVLVFTDITS
jgi:hypothetical protein